VKNNLAPPQPSLAYRLDGPKGQTPSLSWLGPSTLTAKQLLAGPARTGPRNRASQFVKSFLANGPRSSNDLWSAAQEQGLSKRTLMRAKRHLRVLSRRACRDDVTQWYWLLPGQTLPAAPEAPSLTPNLDRYLAELERRNPPPTPLDEDEDLDS
jgi:hypothetical protein